MEFSRWECKLVHSCAFQGDSISFVSISYRAGHSHGVIVSAVKTLILLLLHSSIYVLRHILDFVRDITTSVSVYKTFLTKSHLSRKLVDLICGIKFVNNLLYILK